MFQHNRPHRVYMSFFQMEGWQVQFLDPDLKTSLPLKLTLEGPENLRELALQGDALGTEDARRTFEHAIQTGRGGIYLRLKPEQYRKLGQPKGPEPAAAYLDLIRKPRRVREPAILHLED
jgi:hypothetical protein